MPLGKDLSSPFVNQGKSEEEGLDLIISGASLLTHPPTPQTPTTSLVAVNFLLSQEALQK